MSQNHPPQPPPLLPQGYPVIGIPPQQGGGVNMVNGPPSPPMTTGSYQQHPPQQQQQQVPQPMQRVEMKQQQDVNKLLGEVMNRMTDFTKFHLKRPKDNNISFWIEFIKEFFAPGGVFKHTVHLDQESKTYDLAYEVLPRFFQVAYDSGIKDFSFAFDHHSADITGDHQNQLVYLESNRIRVLILFENLQVHLDGTLRVYLSTNLKIISFHFETLCYQELIPRPTVDHFLQEFQLNSPSAKLLESLSHLSSHHASPSSSQSPLSMLAARADELVRSPVNEYGVPPLMMRCYEVSDIFNDLDPLLQFIRRNSILENDPKLAMQEFINVNQYQQQQQQQQIQHQQQQQRTQQPYPGHIQQPMLQHIQPQVGGGGGGHQLQNQFQQQLQQQQEQMTQYYNFPGGQPMHQPPPPHTLPPPPPPPQSLHQPPNQFQQPPPPTPTTPHPTKFVDYKGSLPNQGNQIQIQGKATKRPYNLDDKTHHYTADHENHTIEISGGKKSSVKKKKVILSTVVPTPSSQPNSSTTTPTGTPSIQSQNNNVMSPGSGYSNGGVGSPYASNMFHESQIPLQQQIHHQNLQQKQFQQHQQYINQHNQYHQQLQQQHQQQQQLQQQQHGSPGTTTSTTTTTATVHLKSPPSNQPPGSPKVQPSTPLDSSGGGGGGSGSGSQSNNQTLNVSSSTSSSSTSDELNSTSSCNNDDSPIKNNLNNSNNKSNNNNGTSSSSSNNGSQSPSSQFTSDIDAIYYQT